MREFDLIMFMGQSNMAGRGVVSEKWPQPAVECRQDTFQYYRQAYNEVGDIAGK